MHVYYGTISDRVFRKQINSKRNKSYFFFRFQVERGMYGCTIEWVIFCPSSRFEEENLLQSSTFGYMVSGSKFDLFGNLCQMEVKKH